MGGSIIQTGVSSARASIAYANAVVDHDRYIGSFCHINCNAVIPAMNTVSAKLKINYGQIYMEE